MAIADNSPSIEKFIDGIVEEKGMENLDPEVLVQIKKDLNDRIEDRIDAAIVEALPADKMDQFNTLLDQSSGQDEKIQEFLKNNVSNIEALVASELMKFRDIYLAS